jgi:hypothetical protein
MGCHAKPAGANRACQILTDAVQPFVAIVFAVVAKRLERIHALVLF